MPCRIAKFEPTPNPNAIKCVLDRPLASAHLAVGQTRSFRSAEQAQTDALASRLFGVPGVTGVLLADTWLTINKASDSPWKAIKAGVEKVLAETD